MSLNLFLQTEAARRGFSQADLHRETGITKALLSAYFAGTKKPHGKNLGRLALALGVSVEEILAADGRAPSQTKLFGEIKGDVVMDRIQQALAQFAVVRSEKAGAGESAKAAWGVIGVIFESMPETLQMYRIMKERGVSLEEFAKHAWDYTEVSSLPALKKAREERRATKSLKTPKSSE